MDTELRWEGEGAVGSGRFLAQYIAGFRLCLHELLTAALCSLLIARGNTKCRMCVDCIHRFFVHRCTVSTLSRIR